MDAQDVIEQSVVAHTEPAVIISGIVGSSCANTMKLGEY